MIRTKQTKDYIMLNRIEINKIKHPVKSVTFENWSGNTLKILPTSK